MKNIKQKVFAGLLCIIVCFATVIPPLYVQAARGNGPKRWNIVFVTDESRSMDGSDSTGVASDPDNLRYDAIKLFAQEITDQGNYLGSVSFAKDVLDYQEMKETNGKQAKDAYVEKIAGVNTDSYTNIGAALMKAVELLKGGDGNLESAIILLSDGNTLMPKDERELSHELKAEAVEACRQGGIKIFTICLNVNHDADVNELKQIATATGGEFTEVDSPEDLLEVETLYYRMLKSNGGSLEGEQPKDAKIGGDGTVTQDFHVPKIGVEELNILIEGKVDSVSFKNPLGQTIDNGSVDEITTTGNGYLMTKLIRPIPGDWQVTAYGDPDAEIRLRYMNNSSFYIDTSIDPSSGYKLNSSVSFYAEAYDGNGRVTDQSALSEMKAEIILESNGEESRLPMSLEGDRFTGSFTPVEQGTYYAKVTVSIDSMSDTSEGYEISVDNGSPVPPEDMPKAHANIWPIIGGKASIDLDGTATDPDGDQLTYSIENSAFNTDDYSLSGTNLTVSHYSIPKGSFTIKATDPHGAYCKFDVLFTSTNIGLIMAIFVLVVIIAVLLVIAFTIRKLRGIPFLGTITVSAYRNGDGIVGQSMSDTPGRGKRSLLSFNMGPMGFAKNTFFQAAGPDRKVIFKSNRPFYSDAMAGPGKSVDIMSGIEVHIYPTEEMTDGIAVTFTSLYGDLSI